IRVEMNCRSGVLRRLRISFTNLAEAATWVEEPAAAGRFKPRNSRQHFAEHFAERTGRDTAARLRDRYLLWLQSPDFPRIWKVKVVANRAAQPGFENRSERF